MARPGSSLESRVKAAERAIARAPVSGNWTPALQLVAQAVGGWGCHLTRLAPDLGVLASAVSGISQDMLCEFAARQGASPAVNQRAAAIYNAPVLRACGEADFIAMREWAASPFYNDFLLKADAPYSIFGKLFDSVKDATTVIVLRSKSQGHASATDKATMNYLLPKLQAAAGVQHSLDERGLTIAARSLDKAGVAAVICDAHLNILSISDAGEAALKRGEFISSSRGKIKLATQHLQQKLQRAVSFASLLYDDRQACSRLKITDQAGAERRILAVAPAGEGGDSMLQRGVLLLLLGSEISDGATIKNAVKLTNAEIEIGEMLIRGRTTREIASYRAVSRATVQTQIKAMSGKFAANHRAELLIALQNWFRG